MFKNLAHSFAKETSCMGVGGVVHPSFPGGKLFPCSIPSQRFRKLAIIAHGKNHRKNFPMFTLPDAWKASHPSFFANCKSALLIPNFPAAASMLGNVIARSNCSSVQFEAFAGSLSLAGPKKISSIEICVRLLCVFFIKILA